MQTVDYVPKNRLKPPAVIFDLDNTLIAVDHIFHKLVDRISSFIQEHYDLDLKQLFQTGLSVQPWLSMHALLNQSIPADFPPRKAILNRALSHYETLPFDVSDYETIKLLPHAREVLSYLKDQGYLICLVTKGDLTRQQTKIEKIHPELFDFIEVADDKRETFRKIIARYGIDPAASFVVGDKKDLEIKIGNQLGFTTIQFAYGRHHGRPLQNTIETPAFTVYNMQELLMFFKRLHHEF